MRQAQMKVELLNEELEMVVGGAPYAVSSDGNSTIANTQDIIKNEANEQSHLKSPLIMNMTLK